VLSDDRHPVSAERLAARELARDLATVQERLREELRTNKALRGRLRRVLNCVDLKCSLCALCLDAIRED
jgi:hypothetical protein